MKQILIEWFGYATYVAEFRKYHWSWTYEEALEWAACYPAGMDVVVFKGWHVVGRRGSVLG